MDIVVIAHFSSDDTVSNDRFGEVSERLSRHGYCVEMITSSFSHVRKAKRRQAAKHPNFTVTHVREPGYTRNVSVRRIISHRVMAQNLSKHLSKRSKPDLIYCAVPSLAVGAVVSRYCTVADVPLVVDVQDLWPEAFEMVLPAQRLTAPLLEPMRRTANRIYRAADAVVAVSQTFADRVLRVQEKPTPTEVVYLGTDLAKFDVYARREPTLDSLYNEDELRLVYVGTHGHSYDLPLVCDAIAEASVGTERKLRLITMGDGPKLQQYRQYAESAGIAATFLGRLPYPDMVANLVRCHIAVNPIRVGSAGSVINKVADYAAAGLPVANTQDNPEYQTLLDQWQAGRNAQPGQVSDLASHILALANGADLRERLGRNNRRLAEEKFDRRSSYPRIINLLVSLVESIA